MGLIETAILATAGLYGAKKIISKRADKRKKQERDFAEHHIAEYSKFLADVLIIDSNIWMNDKYHSFFECLKICAARKEYIIQLPGVQFDEIVNIKKNTDFVTTQNKNARLAIDRIESLQKENLLQISTVTIDSQSNAYADPLIIKLLIKNSSIGRNCILISDDKELRIRSRQVLSDNSSKSNWQVTSISSELNNFEKTLEGAEDYDYHEYYRKYKIYTPQSR